jgi:hypothetical protein
MGNSDSVSLMGLKGHVKVETFDARTGMREKWTEGDNVFTNYGLRIFRNSCALLIGGHFGRNIFVPEYEPGGSRHWMDNARYQSMGLLQYLYLTDNMAPLTASNVTVQGNITGWSERATTASTDPLRGTLNINESLFANNRLTAVYDFATDKANGTHCSVFFADRTPTEYQNDLLLYGFSGHYATLARAYVWMVEGDDGYFYGTVGDILYKIDPITLEEISSYTLPATLNNNNTLFGVYNGYCYFHVGSGSSTPLYCFRLSDSTFTTFSIATSYARGGAIVDGYLYYAYSNTRVYKVDLSTGTATFNTVSLPGTSSGGALRCSGGYLYYVVGGGGLSGSPGGSSANFYLYDYNANTVGDAVFARAGYNFVFSTYSLPAGTLWLQVNASSYYDGGTTSISRSWLSKYDLSQPLAGAITAKLLDEPVTKLDTQTMKVTYTISII